MNSSCKVCDKATVAAYVIGILGAFLIMGFLAGVMVRATRPPGIDQARIALRLKNRAELQAADRTALATYGVLDPTRGVVRIPIDRAIEMSIALWQDPAAGRSNLLARVDKATAKPPEKPNEYE